MVRSGSLAAALVATLSLGCVTNTFGVGRLKPAPNIDLPGQTTPLTLVIDGAVPDGFGQDQYSMHRDVQIDNAVRVSDWHASLQAGFDQGFAPLATSGAGAPAAERVHLLEADLQIVVGPAWHGLIRYKLRLESSSGAVLCSDAGSALSLPPRVDAPEFVTPGVRSAIEVMYEQFAKACLRR